MHPNLYLLFTALLCPSVNSCQPGHHAQQKTDTTGVETQLKLLRARKEITPPVLPASKTALRNVRVFDGWGFGEPSTVVIHGDSITFDTSQAQHTIDGEGGFLLPGLIDSHIHLSKLESLETLTRYGVTSVMNMGCSNYTLCSAFREQIGLTSFFTAGEGAVAPNSTHAKVFGATGFVHSPNQAPEFVAEVFENGSDYMKLIAEGDGFNQATHNALVSATHALGKVSMTHCQDFASYEVAIRSKTDGLQHVPFDIPISKDMVQRIKQQGQHVTPTLNIGKIVTKNETIESIVSPGVSLTYEAGVISVQRLMRAAVTILAGTDANDKADEFLKSDLIGVTLHKELQYLKEAGMSEVDVLRAATVVPSITHNLTGRGFIREGYRADLVLLKPGSNPLQNISATADISRVWVGGFESTLKR
jgi:imidazolonepropionase-like amidohydrolase